MNYPTANIEERLGKFFLIRNKSQPDFVLEIKDGQDKPSVPLVVGLLNEDHQVSNHQLWFMDSITWTIRSKLNSFCIDYNANEELVVRPFMGSRSQQWVVREDYTIAEREFDNVVSVKNDSVRPGAPCHVTSFEELPSQQWIIAYLPARYFVIRHHCQSGKVLDVKGELSFTGAQVIAYGIKHPVGDNQLWYEDQNGVIHSKLNDFVINVLDMDVMMYPYNSENCGQQWVINGRLIQDKCQPLRVLDMRTSYFQTYNTVVIGEHEASRESQLWSFEEVPIDPYAFDHDGKGRYFVIFHSHFDVVLNVDMTSKSPPYGVNLSKLKLQPNGMFSEHQLFFYDHVHGVIKSKANERLCLEAQDTNLILGFYQTNSPSQQLECQSGKISLKNGGSLVLTLGTTIDPYDPSSMQCYFIDDINSHHQIWSLKRATAQPFFLEVKAGGKVLEARKDSGYPTCSVVLTERKPQTRSANQLWYEDETGFIRSKLNGCVLDSSNSCLHTDRYNSLNPHQGWVISKDHIRNRNNGLVLDATVQKKWMSNSIAPAENSFSDSQRWTLLYV